MMAASVTAAKLYDLDVQKTVYAQGIAGSMLELALTLAKGEGPAASLPLTDEKYIWLPYQRVTLRQLEAEQGGV